MYKDEPSPVETTTVDGDLSVGDAAVEAYKPTQEAMPKVLEGGTILVPPVVHPTGFFDPFDPEKEPDVLLRRVLVEREVEPSRSWIGRRWQQLLAIMSEPEREMFELLKPIAYHDKASSQVVIVPSDIKTFRTDLTSVPQLFTWLVPKTGDHLPAALIHDGLVHESTEPPSYIANRAISRSEADRIFRDGMRDLGSSWVRRWLVWATVMMATLVSGAGRIRWTLTALATIGTILVFGTLATVDLFDCGAPLPWMGERAWWIELLSGGAAALVITGGLSLLWWPVEQSTRAAVAAAAVLGVALVIVAVSSGDTRLTLLALLMVVVGLVSFSFVTGRVALIVGVALSLLYHVTLAVAVVFAIFAVAESLFERKYARATLSAMATAALVAPLVWIGVAAC